jgi:hypothetical protein
MFCKTPVASSPDIWRVRKLLTVVSSIQWRERFIQSARNRVSFKSAEVAFWWKHLRAAKSTTARPVTGLPRNLTLALRSFTTSCDLWPAGPDAPLI